MADNKVGIWSVFAVYTEVAGAPVMLEPKISIVFADSREEAIKVSGMSDVLAASVKPGTSDKALDMGCVTIFANCIGWAKSTVK